MTCGWNNCQPSVEEGDDLSSVSCISRHFAEYANNNATQRTNDQGLLERFENEFLVAKQTHAPSSPAVSSGDDGPESPFSTLPTELFLPIDKRSHRTTSTTTSSSSTSSWCKIPHWSQYPPVLKALFVICFICIIVAIGLIVFAVVVQAREGDSPQAWERSFDLTDWGNGDTNKSGDSDIFVQEGGGVAGTSADDGTASAPTPTVASPSGSSVQGTPATMPTFYTPASTLPQTMAKKKQMGANKDGNDKGNKVFNKDDKENDEKDDDQRKRQRTRRAREMKPPLVYPR